MIAFYFNIPWDQGRNKYQCKQINGKSVKTNYILNLLKMWKLCPNIKQPFSSHFTVFGISPTFTQEGNDSQSKGKNYKIVIYITVQIQISQTKQVSKENIPLITLAYGQKPELHHVHIGHSSKVGIYFL